METIVAAGKVPDRSVVNTPAFTIFAAVTAPLRMALVEIASTASLLVLTAPLRMAEFVTASAASLPVFTAFAAMLIAPAFDIVASPVICTAAARFDALPTQR